MTRQAIGQLGNVGRRGVTEVFCGSGRLRASLVAHGVPVEGWDINVGVDLLDARTEHRLRGLIAMRRVGMVWLATECKTFSIASGANCLRASHEPMGKANLRSHQCDRLRNANALLRVSLRVICACWVVGVACCLENSHTSLLWRPQMLCRLRNEARHVWHKTVLDFCQFGEVYRKRARLACVNNNLAPLERQCVGAHGVCSRSSKHRVWLQGRDASGLWRTAAAQVYPLPLCDAASSFSTSPSRNTQVGVL